MKYLNWTYFWIIIFIIFIALSGLVIDRTSRKYYLTNYCPNYNTQPQAFSVQNPSTNNTELPSTNNTELTKTGHRFTKNQRVRIIRPGTICYVHTITETPQTISFNDYSFRTNWEQFDSQFDYILICPPITAAKTHIVYVKKHEIEPL